MTGLGETAALVRGVIREVPDFPKPGIQFKDITPLLADVALFRAATAALVAPFAASRVTHVVGIESRGFIFGAPVAQALRAGFVPVRKAGKLPAATIREEYALEYGTDALEMHSDALGAGAIVLIVDDVLATGGTAVAACALVERTGAVVAGCSFLIELAALKGRSRLPEHRIEALVRY